MTKSKTVLVDADSFGYMIGSYTQMMCVKIEPGSYLVTDDDARARRWATENGGFIAKTPFYGSLEDAVHRANVLLHHIKQAVDCKEAKLFVSVKSNENLRLDIDPSYKNNRQAAKPPFHTGIINHLINTYSALECAGVEADDVVVAEYLKHPDTTIIASIDKDLLRMVPGTHYNYSTKQFVTTSKAQAVINFCTYMLSGDRGDNIKGLMGYGEPKFAEDGTIAEKPKNTGWTQLQQLGFPKYDNNIDYLSNLVKALGTTWVVYLMYYGEDEAAAAAHFLRTANLLFLPITDFHKIKVPIERAIGVSEDDINAI